MVVLARYITPTLLECTTPETAIVATYNVRVSQNGQDFSKAALAYDFEEPLRLHSVVPKRGSTLGGTKVYITGDGFSARA